jgi:hypothetical protein
MTEEMDEEEELEFKGKLELRDYVINELYTIAI